MSLVKGVNSYALVSEADVYFSTRVGSDNWFNATSDQKAATLVTASGLLDELPWTGFAESAEQDLAFPRTGNYFEPRLGRLVPMSGYPKRLVNSTFELALHFMSNEDVLEDSGSVKGLKISGVELTEIKSASRIPSSVMKIVRPMLVNRGGAMWWRAN